MKLTKTIMKGFCTMALACGMVTCMAPAAFAAGITQLENGDAAEVTEGAVTDVEGTGAGKTVTATGETTFGVYGSTAQMKISVPTKVALAVNGTGGQFARPDAMTDESTGYGIVNRSGFAVKVTKVRGTNGSIGALTTPGTGNVVAKPTTGSALINLAVNMTTSAGGNLGTGTSQWLKTSDANVSSITGWTIPAATAEAPGILGIELDGYSSELAGALATSAAEAADAFKASYTIALA